MAAAAAAAGVEKISREQTQTRGGEIVFNGIGFRIDRARPLTPDRK